MITKLIYTIIALLCFTSVAFATSDQIIIDDKQITGGISTNNGDPSADLQEEGEPLDNPNKFATDMTLDDLTTETMADERFLKVLDQPTAIDKFLEDEAMAAKLDSAPEAVRAKFDEKVGARSRAQADVSFDLGDEPSDTYTPETDTGEEIDWNAEDEGEEQIDFTEQPDSEDADSAIIDDTATSSEGADFTNLNGERIAGALEAEWGINIGVFDESSFEGGLKMINGDLVMLGTNEEGKEVEVNRVPMGEFMDKYGSAGSYDIKLEENGELKVNVKKKSAEDLAKEREEYFEENKPETDGDTIPGPEYLINAPSENDVPEIELDLLAGATVTLIDGSARATIDGNEVKLQNGIVKVANDGGISVPAGAEIDVIVDRAELNTADGEKITYKEFSFKLKAGETSMALGKSEEEDFVSLEQKTVDNELSMAITFASGRDGDADFDLTNIIIDGEPQTSLTVRGDKVSRGSFDVSNRRAVIEQNGENGEGNEIDVGGWKVHTNSLATRLRGTPNEDRISLEVHIQTENGKTYITQTEMDGDVPKTYARLLNGDTPVQLSPDLTPEEIKTELAKLGSAQEQLNFLKAFNINNDVAQSIIDGEGFASFESIVEQSNIDFSPYVAGNKDLDEEFLRVTAAAYMQERERLIKAGYDAPDLETYYAMALAENGARQQFYHDKGSSYESYGAVAVNYDLMKLWGPNVGYDVDSTRLSESAFNEKVRTDPLFAARMFAIKSAGIKAGKPSRNGKGVDYYRQFLNDELSAEEEARVLAYVSNRGSTGLSANYERIKAGDYQFYESRVDNVRRGLELVDSFEAPQQNLFASLGSYAEPTSPLVTSSQESRFKRLDLIRNLNLAPGETLSSSTKNSEDMRKLQEFLVANGYMPPTRTVNGQEVSNIDRWGGDITERAIKSFQNDLEVEDNGVVGSITIGAALSQESQVAVAQRNPQTVAQGPAARTYAKPRRIENDVGTGRSASFNDRTVGDSVYKVQAGIDFADEDAVVIGAAENLMDDYEYYGSYCSAFAQFCEFGDWKLQNWIEDAWDAEEILVKNYGGTYLVKASDAQKGDFLFSGSKGSSYIGAGTGEHGEITTHIMRVVSNNNGDPVIAHRFGSETYVETLSNFMSRKSSYYMVSGVRVGKQGDNR